MTAPAPVAIVGMSCRLPGRVSSLDEFWTLLSRARSGWSEIPKSRFNVDAYRHPSPQKRGCFNQVGGYFMQHDLSNFDAPFFNITELEAKAMDPQQRQLLECTFEALENAGFPKETVAGTQVGVFVGGAASDYRMGTLRDLQSISLFDATGNHQSVLSGRISHYFDFRGPSCTVDTACSSGLYALHQAVQSIRSGESSCAVVAGCRLSTEPDDWVSMSMLGIFNEKGKTYTFDHRAKSGFARGEGAGCLILKPLVSALEDNDKIWSVIVNTGVGQDGRTVGLSTPSGEAQEGLMQGTYAQANVSPLDAGYVEAHGTGTKVGDPIESRAIYHVFGSGRTKRNPIYVGSVKTNVGHLENVSGIISIIKATLMLEKGFILPNINFEKANETIPLDQWNMKVPTSLKPWPREKRFISINNFGFSGSNAHCILERPPRNLRDLPLEKALSSKLVVLSANDKKAVEIMVKNLGLYMEQHPEAFQKRALRDIAYTLGERRSHMQWRVALAAQSCTDAVALLNSVDSKPLKSPSKKPQVAFVYTGQGAQWATMGKELLESHPVFADTILAADSHLKSFGANFSLLDELIKEVGTSQVDRAHISQPICTALQIALTELFNSFGIRPMAVTGHSSGEIAAAYAAGAIDIETAMAIAYYRGQATQRMKERHPELRGAMLAVAASRAQVQLIIRTLPLHGVSIACENSPNSITASGNETMINQLAAELESRSIFNRKLRVDIAYHSAHMESVAEYYHNKIQNIRTKHKNEVTFFSSLKGDRIHDLSSLGPKYWVDNLVRPVLFSSALQNLVVQNKPDLIVEIGPHAALQGPVKQILGAIGGSAADIHYLPSLMRNKNATVSTLKLAGSLFTKGYAVNFAAINLKNESIQKPSLVSDFAPYPWTDHKYWAESRLSRQHRLKPFGRHDLLGLLTDNCLETEPVWRNIITTDDVPWLKDHKMQSLTTFPLAGYLSMAVEAASQRAIMRRVTFEHFILREVQASHPLIMDDGSDYETVLSLSPYATGTRSYSDEWDEFRISSWTSSRGWFQHCRGLVGVRNGNDVNLVHSSIRERASMRLVTAETQCNTAVDLRAFYTELNYQGASYGPSFQLQGDSRLRVAENLSLGRVRVPDTAPRMPMGHETPSILSTAFMDLFLQLTFAILGAGQNNMQTLYMPSFIKQLELDRKTPNTPEQQLHVVAQAYDDPSRTGPVDFSIHAWHDFVSEPVVKILGFRMTPINDKAPEETAPRSLCYKIEWKSLGAQEKDLEGSYGHVNGVNGSSDNTRGIHGHFNVHSIAGIDNDAPVNYEANRPENDTYGINGHVNNSNKHVNGLDGSLSTLNYANGYHTEVSEGYGSPEEPDVVIVANKCANNLLSKAIADEIIFSTDKTPVLATLAELIPSKRHYICLCEIEDELLFNMTPELFVKMQKLLSTSNSVLWVSTGAYNEVKQPLRNIVQGLFRTVRSEANKSLGTLDLDPESTLNESQRAELIVKTFKILRDQDEDGPRDYEFSEKQCKLAVPRVVEDAEANRLILRETQSYAPYLQDFQQAGRKLTVAVKIPGALDSLYYTDEVEQHLASDEIVIKVAATGMNFKDVVIAMGQVSSPYLGIECSGTVERVGTAVTSIKEGDRVCAVSLGAYSTYARCKATSASVIPQDMSMEIAASIPVVFSTAYYGIIEVARLEPGERILIHAASGGVGQAAIQLAQMIGAEIFATVGNHEKKQLLMTKYRMNEDHIFYSRSTQFGQAIQVATGGNGVDVVINSLAGDLLRETWECIAHFGRFVEIGKRDITTNTRLEMAKFNYNATFSSVDLTLLAAERPKIMGRVLSTVMALVVDKRIQPVEPITVMGISEVEKALRMLQGGKTSGKVVIQHSANDQVKATHRSRAGESLRREATYIIIGGTGGLGRSMARWLTKHGAKHIVLLSRKGTITGEIQRLCADANASDVNIHIKACDVADASSVDLLVTECTKTMPPIRGVIHSAMVLRDMLFEKMTFEDWSAVVSSKVAGAWHFHNALLSSSSELDFFVMLSSVAGIVGNRGQASYAAANTFLDALAWYRRSLGLPAASLNLTAISDVGYLAENASRYAQVTQNLASGTMCEAEMLDLLGGAIRGEVVGQCITGLDYSDGGSLPYYASDSRFAPLHAASLEISSLKLASKSSSSPCIQQQLRHADSPEKCLSVVRNGLREKLCAILMLSLDDMDMKSSMTACGLDSLNAIELRNWVGKEMGVHLQVLELLTSGTLTSLSTLILRKTSFDHCCKNQGV